VHIILVTNLNLALLLLLLLLPEYCNKDWCSWTV